MAPGMLVATGVVLGAVLVLVAVTVGKARQASHSPTDEVAGERLLATVEEPIAFLRGDGIVAFTNATFADLVDTDPEGKPIEAAMATAPELERRVVEEDEGTVTVETDDGVVHYDVSLSSTSEDGLMVVCHDVTDLYEHRCRLEERTQQLDRFASRVSHDLRNPLDVAIGRANAVAEVVDDPELVGHVESIQGSLDRMETIIDDALVLSREGEVIGETSSIPLADLSNECWEQVETGEATLQVIENATIEADVAGLSHVFENLFRNAVEHGSTSPDSQSRQDAVEHAGADVTVSVGTLEERDGFYVADDGPGIPDGDRERVCEPGTTGNACGTGMGLAIVDSIAAAHGWDVDITTSDCGGARFEFAGVDTESRVQTTRDS